MRNSSHSRVDDRAEVGLVSQPQNFNRQLLLAANLPIEWAEQERLFGFAG